MKFISWTNGWKTYLTVFVGLGTGVAQYYGVHIPGYVEVGLGFLGLGTARMAITAQSKQTTVDVALLIQDVLSQVTIPTPSRVTTNTVTQTVSTPVDIIPKPISGQVGTTKE